MTSLPCLRGTSAPGRALPLPACDLDGWPCWSRHVDGCMRDAKNEKWIEGPAAPKHGRSRMWAAGLLRRAAAPPHPNPPCVPLPATPSPLVALAPRARRCPRHRHRHRRRLHRGRCGLQVVAGWSHPPHGGMGGAPCAGAPTRGPGPPWATAPRPSLPAPRGRRRGAGAAAPLPRQAGHWRRPWPLARWGLVVTPGGWAARRPPAAENCTSCGAAAGAPGGLQPLLLRVRTHACMRQVRWLARGPRVGGVGREGSGERGEGLI